MTAAPRYDAGVERRESGLEAYTGALKRHWFFIAAMTAVALFASLLWLAVKAPVYEASAQILVTPIDEGDTTFVGVGVVRDSGDPTRTMETAAGLIGSETAYEATSRQLGRNWTRERVKDQVVVEPVGQSNIIDITARGRTPHAAALLAGKFAASSLQQRRDFVARQAQERLRALGDATSQGERGSSGTPDAGDALLVLRAAAAGHDPTLALSQPPLLPEDASGPPRAVVAVLAILGGLALGVGGALGLDNTSRRGATEDEILASHPGPVLARVPLLRRFPFGSRRYTALDPTPQARDAYRTLLAQLERETPLSVLITSGSGGDGKTTVAIGLALAAGAAGHRVLLLDLDLRKPQVGSALEFSEAECVPVELVTSGQPLASLLVSHPRLPSLRVLALRPTTATDLALDTFLRRLPGLLAQASEVADIVIVDAPPLGEVSDALRIVERVDAVVVVARPGHTRLASLRTMRDILERIDRPALGQVLIGTVPDGHPYGEDRIGPLSLSVPASP